VCGVRVRVLVRVCAHMLVWYVRAWACVCAFKCGLDGPCVIQANRVSVQEYSPVHTEFDKDYLGSEHFTSIQERWLLGPRHHMSNFDH